MNKIFSEIDKQLKLAKAKFLGGGRGRGLDCERKVMNEKTTRKLLIQMVNACNEGEVGEIIASDPLFDAKIIKIVT